MNTDKILYGAGLLLTSNGETANLETVLWISKEALDILKTHQLIDQYDSCYSASID